MKGIEKNTFVQEPLVSVVGFVSDSEDVPIVGGAVGGAGLAEVVVVDVVGIAAVVTTKAGTLEAIDVAIEVNVAPVVRILVCPVEFGPARTASDTGWPLCNAAETCERRAFC